MHHVRPYKLFALIDEPPAARTVQASIPCRRGAGGVTLLETFLILSAMRVVRAKKVFEFGTYLGSTTLNLALNLPEDGAVFTLDLDEDHALAAKQDQADVPLTETHLASKAALDFAASPTASKIQTLTGNSATFDFSGWKGAIDLIFIDGGHDLDTVKSDTENALRMAARPGPSCVLWHDYRNRDYSGLTYYLDQLSHEIAITHVDDTSLCAWFSDPEASILPRLWSA